MENKMNGMKKKADVHLWDKRWDESRQSRGFQSKIMRQSWAMLWREESAIVRCWTCTVKEVCHFYPREQCHPPGCDASIPCSVILRHIFLEDIHVIWCFDWDTNDSSQIHVRYAENRLILILEKLLLSIFESDLRWCGQRIWKIFM